MSQAKGDANGQPRNSSNGPKGSNRAEGAENAGHAERSDRTAATDAGGDAGDTGGRDVLVVEDDPEINELVGAYATIAGFNYRSALNGADALAEVGRSVPALIVLDLMLPDMNGFEICRRVKQEQRTQSIPVVFLTALDSEASRQQGRQVGGAEYLTKPFDPDRLMAAINRHAAK